jgi:hypothetical protein
MRTDRSAEWRGKVQPELLKLADIYKVLVQMHKQSKHMTPKERETFYNEPFGGKEPDLGMYKAAYEELRKLVTREGEEQGAAGDAFYAASLSAAARTTVKVGDHEVCCELPVSEKLAGNRWLLGMAEFLAQQRFGRPLYQIQFEDSAGHKDSSEMMLRILDDGHRLRYGELIKPPKGKIDHRILLDLGLGRGLEELTNEELASFLDNFCPTCEDHHNADSIGRQRKSILEQRQNAIHWSPENLNPTRKSPTTPKTK